MAFAKVRILACVSLLGASVPAHAHKMMIPAAAFQPQYDNSGAGAFNLVRGSEFGWGLFLDDDVVMTMNAHVPLPEGSVITSFRCAVQDYHEQVDVTVRLREVSKSPTAVNPTLRTIVSASSQGSPVELPANRLLGGSVASFPVRTFEAATGKQYFYAISYSQNGACLVPNGTPTVQRCGIQSCLVEYN